jgi:ABC-type sugar transport system ATPase subunit
MSNCPGCQPTDSQALRRVCIGADRAELSAIPKGSIVSIIGPNGAGKTTFFNCITGFYQIDDGDIVFDGTSLKGRSPDKITRLGIARTYQNIRLFAYMSAIENILAGMEPRLRSPWYGPVLGLRGTRASRKRRQWARRANCCASSACAARATAWPATCPMATSGGWRSLARWPATPSCCCSTNRPRA